MRRTLAALLVASVAVSEAARGQSIPLAAEVFGNPISKEADAWLADSNAEFNRAIVELQKWTGRTTAVEVLLPQRRVVFRGQSDRVTFDARIIGTMRRSDKTWEWAWNNPNIDWALAVPSDKLQALGRRFGLKYLTHGIVPVPMEQFPSLLSGITLKLHGGTGIYMAPSDNGLDTYLLLANPRR